MLNLENRILYKQPCLFSAMVVTGKLRVNQIMKTKTNTLFFLCLLYDEKQTDKKTEGILYFSCII